MATKQCIQGKKKKLEEQEIIALDPQPVSNELKKRRSYFIRRVYETDPLICPKCQGEMRIISFIDQPEVINKILQHLGLWEESHAPSARNPSVKEIPSIHPTAGCHKSLLLQSGAVVQAYPLDCLKLTQRHFFDYSLPKMLIRGWFMLCGWLAEFAKASWDQVEEASFRFFWAKLQKKILTRIRCLEPKARKLLWQTGNLIIRS
jgi:hypothetical protein